MSSITMDINDEQHSLVGFLSKVLVVQRQAKRFLRYKKAPYTA